MDAYKHGFVVKSQKELEELMGPHDSDSWKGAHTGKGRLETFMDSFCTEARWHKAVQHLREAGKLINDPKDIGLLVKEVHRDLAEEEREAIKNWLFLNFIGDINRAAAKGLPEWYKEQLFAKVFGEAEA